MPRNANSSVLLGLGALAALAAGAGLGWWLWPAPQPAVAARVIEGPRKPASLAVAETKKAHPLPYDLTAMRNPSALELARFEAWLMTASCDEVTRLIAGLQSTNGGLGMRDPASRLVFQRFADFSSDERLHALQEHIPAEIKGNDYYLRQAVTALGQDMLPARKEEIAALMKRFPYIGDHEITQMVGSAWVKEDFEGAKAFIESLAKNGGTGVSSLYHMLAREDMPAAQARALALPPGDEKNKALGAVAGIMARADFAGALQWLQQQGLTDANAYRHGGFFSGPFEGVFSAAAHHDPAGAAASVLENPGLFENERGPTRVNDLFKTWAGKDLAAARAWLAANPLPEKFDGVARRALDMAELSQLPLNEALAKYKEWPPSMRERAGHDLAMRLVSEDPANALDILADLLPAGRRASVMGSILGNLPPGNEEQILRRLPELMEVFRQDPDDIHRLSSLPTEDVQAAMEKLSEADRNTMQTALAEQALGHGGDGDVEKALALLPEIDPNAKDPFLYSRIAVNLAQTDPQRAAEWVADFPEGSSKEWAARNLVATWAKYDPDAAAAWVGHLPAGASRDRSGIEVAYLQALAGDHQSALRVADGVGDESQRGVAYGNALQSLWRRDQAAAERALEAAHLSPDRRERVRTRLRQGEYQR